jgi:L-ascorbate metabolism protein UlaG (beta-lactamase superfamily)
MQITHFGHSCLLLDTGAARLLIDPGAWSAGFESLTGLDAVLITHQHPDHLDTDRLTPLLAANPDARLVVDPGTATRLSGIEHSVTRPGETLQLGGARVEVLGGSHAVIHPDIPTIANNAYLVDGTHLHPGDSLATLPVEVDVLFLPTAAPWLKLAEAVGYLREMAPRAAVPIHEGVLGGIGTALYYRLFTELAPEGTQVQVLDRAAPTTV